MRKILLTASILGAGLFVAVYPGSAKAASNSWWAALAQIAQEVITPTEGGQPNQPAVEEQPANEEESVDPREVQQVQREIKDQKRQLNTLAKQAKKLANGEAIVGEVSALLEQVNNFESQMNSGVSLRDVIQEFRDAQLWDELNKLRAKIEIPKQITQAQKEIKKLETWLKQKKYQNLGLDLGATTNKLDEAKSALVKVQELYSGGDFESAQEEFQALREDFNPVDIGNVMQRTQELMNRLKSVKDSQIKEQVKGVWQEVIDNFNQKEYRVSWELMNESWNDVTKVIFQASNVGKKRGVSQQNFQQMTDRLEEQMKNKADEKRAKLEEKKQPQQPVQPTESNPSPAPQPAPQTIQPQSSSQPTESNPSPASQPAPQESPVPTR